MIYRLHNFLKFPKVYFRNITNVYKIETFLTDIGMITTNRMIIRAFAITCGIKKIKYGNIILELHKEFQTLKEDIIKSNLKKALMYG